MSDAITNAGITARTNSSHRSAVERRDAAVAAAVAAERARLAEAVRELLDSPALYPSFMGPTIRAENDIVRAVLALLEPDR